MLSHLPRQSTPRPCPTAQDTALYRLPLIEVGRVGQVASLTVPGPKRDDCTKAVTAVTTTVTAPAGAVVPSTGTMTEIASQDYSYISRKLIGGIAEFTPTRWGWHTVRFDFGAVGGQVDARMFIADAMEVTQTLPFTAWSCRSYWSRTASCTTRRSSSEIRTSTRPAGCSPSSTTASRCAWARSRTSDAIAAARAWCTPVCAGTCCSGPKGA